MKSLSIQNREELEFNLSVENKIATVFVNDKISILVHIYPSIVWLVNFEGLNFVQ